MIHSNDNINFVVTFETPFKISRQTQNAAYVILLHKKNPPKSFFFSDLFI